MLFRSLWRNTNGQVFEWLLNGTTIASSGYVSTPVGAEWKIVDASRDLNGDGNSDVLWRNDNGQVFAWMMSAASIASSGYISTPVGAEWVPVF